MDLDLPALLKRAFTDEDPAHRDVVARLVESVDRCPGVAETGWESPLDAVAARMLWLSAHYISATATSHGMQLGCVEGGGAGALPLAAIAAALPTRMVLKRLRWDTAQVQGFPCGGEASEFEKRDLSLFEHDPLAEARLGALVVRCDAQDAAAVGWLNDLIAAQRLVAHVLVVRPAAVAAPVFPALAAGWQTETLAAVPDLVAVDVHVNTEWQPRLDALRDIRFTADIAADTADTAAARPPMVLPLVSGPAFGGITVVDRFPEETLAGPAVRMFSLGEREGQQVHTGRLAAVTTQTRNVYAVENVNLSGTGILWRDGGVLIDSFYQQAHDERFRVGDSAAAVSEPTRTLDGTWFLAPTGNTHHSHLMFETLRKLNFAERFRPGIGLLASSVLTPSQREYFPLFGFAPEDCVFKDPEETVRVERLIFTSEQPQRYDRVSMDYLKRVGAGFYERPTRRPTRLYLTRSDCRSYRNLVNWEEIEAIFEDFGFTTVVASEISAREKIELFSTAEYVAGPLGAAFAYLPFAMNAAAIVLTADLYFPKVYFETAAVQLNQINYIKGIGLRAYTDPWGCEHSSFYTPPDLAVAALRVILGG